MNLGLFFGLYLVIGYTGIIINLIAYGGWSNLLKDAREQEGGEICDYFSENFIKFVYFVIGPLIWPITIISSVVKFVKKITNEGDDDFEYY